MSNPSQPQVARAQMLVRRPAAEVFPAFADPAVTSRFWFSKGSGRLEHGVELKVVEDHAPDVLVRGWASRRHPG